MINSSSNSIPGYRCPYPLLVTVSAYSIFSPEALTCLTASHHIDGRSILLTTDGMPELEDQLVGANHSKFLAGNFFDVIHIGLQPVDTAIHLQILLSQHIVGTYQCAVGLLETTQLYPPVVSEEHNQQEIEHGKESNGHHDFLALIHEVEVFLLNKCLRDVSSGILTTTAKAP